MSERERTLTSEERMRWGVCAVCDAQDGEPCSPNVGLTLGLSMPKAVGAHLARLNAAPRAIREVPVR